MSAIAPENTAGAGAGPSGTAELLRRYRGQIGVAAVVLFLLSLLLVDHTGTPPVVHEATGRDVVTAGTVGLTTTGDPRVAVQPGSLHVAVDNAGLVEVTVVLASTVDQPLVVDGSAKLLSAGAKLLAGSVTGGVMLPAHGTATLRMSGTPPILAIGSVTLTLHATVRPPGG